MCKPSWFFMCTEPNKQTPQGDPVITELVGYIRFQYEPAQTIPEADFTPTTAQVYMMLYKHYPSEAMSQEIVFRLLKDAGYRYEFLPGTQTFVWLMKTA